MQLQLDDVALFTRIAKLGTLSAAARERNVPVSQVTRLLAWPLLRGLIRYPASRSIGSASSAIGGRLARSNRARVVRSGDRLGVGVGLVSRMSAIGAGGCGPGR